MFKSIQIKGWRQFRSVTIDFHPRLTVLTGANGSGKTTILNLLNRHVGWSLPFVSTPLRRRKGPIQFISDFWKRGRPDDEQAGRRRIGRISYSSGQTAELSVPETVSESYEVEIRGQQLIPGLFVSSHRPVYRFEKVREIPTELDPGQQLFDLYLNDIRAQFTGGGGRSPSYQIKRALISLVGVWLFFRFLDGAFGIGRRRGGDRPPSPPGGPRSGGRTHPRQQSPRVEALKVLALPPSADDKQVRAAYRDLARKFHPDRVEHLGPELVELTGEKFKQVQQAYDQLVGTKRR